MRNTQALELPVRARAEFLFRSRPKNLLTLTRESLKLYEEISPSLQPDVKFRKNGRLLVAPNEAEIGFVETRARFLAKLGIRARYFEGSQLWTLEPYLERDAIGASWSPEDA